MRRAGICSGSSVVVGLDDVERGALSPGDGGVGLGGRAASGWLVEGIHALMAEFYSANLASEIKKGMTQKAKRVASLTAHRSAT